MKNKLVVVPTVQDPIKASPGFAKKHLAHYKLDIAALCGFGCSYCSSNSGNYLRINRERFADLTEQQTGERTYPATDPSLMFVWPDILERIERQIASRREGCAWGRDATLVFSMLTDGFSPTLVQDGTTEAALRLVLAKTSFRIRVLTKNAIVGSGKWIEFFQRYADRFVVGLSTGTNDDEWARRVEVGTSVPSARLRALRALQDAGVPTFGMLCPIFPDMVGEQLHDLIDAIRPMHCEDVWAEPYNDRVNWEVVRAGYEPSSSTYQWFERAFGRGDHEWSRYATDLYTRLRDRALREGWIRKLHYLLYEDRIVGREAAIYGAAEFQGVILQSKPAENGRSRNEDLAALQRTTRRGIVGTVEHHIADAYDVISEGTDITAPTSSTWDEFGYPAGGAAS